MTKNSAKFVFFYADLCTKKQKRQCLWVPWWDTSWYTYLMYHIGHKQQIKTRNEGFFVTPYYSCRIAAAGGGWTHFHYLLSWCPHTYCRFGIYWLLCNKISLLKGWFGWKVNWEYHKLKLYVTSENICGWWHQTPRLVCDPHTQSGDFIQFRSF